MLNSAFMLLLSSAFVMLRLGNGSGGSFPKPLSASKEREYVDAWLKSGDMQARNELIEHNLRLVAHIIKKYYTQSLDQEDLISIGTIGLIKGVNTFDTGKGRLPAYLSRCVENEILMHLRSTKKLAAEVSLGESLGEDKDGNSISLMDILSSDILTEERVELSVLSEKLLEAVESCLTERERTVVVLRYGLYGRDPLAQRVIAKRLGISRSYVSRIEKKALEKLLHVLEK